MELSEVILALVGGLSTISAWAVMCAGVAQRLGCPGSSGSGATQTNYGGAGRYWEGCTSGYGGNGGNNGSGGSDGTGTGTGSTGSALAGNTGQIS